MTPEQRTLDKGDGLVEPVGLERRVECFGSDFSGYLGFAVAELLMKDLFGKGGRRWQPEELGQFCEFYMSRGSLSRQKKKKAYRVPLTICPPVCRKGLAVRWHCNLYFPQAASSPVLGHISEQKTRRCFFKDRGSNWSWCFRIHLKGVQAVEGLLLI